MLNIIASRNPNKNTDYMYSKIKENIENKKESYLVVPEQFTLGSELDLFNKLPYEGFSLVSVKSFRSLVADILQTRGGLEKNFISEPAQNILMKMVLDDLKLDLDLYGKNIKDPGFVDLLIQLIKEFKNEDIHPLDLVNLMESPSMSREMTRKLKDINKIYSSYERILSDSLFDGEDRFVLALEKVDQMEAYKDIVFFFDQFHNMSLLEIKLIDSLVKMGAQVYLTVTIDKRLVDSPYQVGEMLVKDAEVFEISKRFLNHLDKYLDLSYIFLEDESFDNPSLNYLLSQVFSYEKPQARSLDNIYLKRYNNTLEEVENLSIAIKKDLIDKGYRYKDIAVIVTSTEEYYKLIKRDFEINNIPFFIDESRNIGENPIVKLVNASLYLFSSNLSTNGLIAYLKYSFNNFSYDQINIFENYIKDRKIRSKMLFDDKYFSLDEKMVKKKYLEEDMKNLKEVEEVRKYLIEAIVNFNDGENFLDFSQEDDLVKNHVYKFYRFISDPIILERIVAYEDRLVGDEKEQLEEENRQIWQGLMDILDDIVNLSGERTMSFMDFSLLVKEGLENINISIIPPSQDQIIVGDISRSRVMNVKKIYFLGMTNIYYPRINKTTDLFLEDEKEVLIDHGISLRTTKDNMSHDESLSLYNLMSRPSKELEFSFSLIDSDNQAMSEAFLLTYIKVCLDPKNIIYRNDTYFNNIYSRSRLSYYLAQKVYDIRSKTNISREEKVFVLSLYKYLEEREDYQALVRAIEEGQAYRREDKLSKEVAMGLYENLSSVSISQIETFQKCPYKHFIDYGLNPRRENNFYVNNLDIGNIIHKSVSGFTKSHLKKKDLEILEMDEIKKLTQKDFEESLDLNVDYYKREDAKNEFFLDLTKESLDISCYEITKQLALSQPDVIRDEERFGRNLVYDAITFKLDDDLEVNIEGIIDRIDEFNIDNKKYLRVIDYKTGNKYFDINKVYNGLDIQLIIYLGALVDGHDYLPIGAFYIPLNGDFSVDYDIDDDDLAQAISDEFKLRGIMIDQREILARIDRSFNLIKEKPESDIVEFKGRRSKLDGKDNVVTMTFMMGLIGHVKDLVEEALRKIQKGNIAARPYRLDKELACTYCEYRGICKFEDKDFRYMGKFDWTYIKEEIEKKEIEGKDD